MNLKLVGRVLFLGALVWVLSSLVGGVNVSVGRQLRGKGKGKGGCGDWRQRQPGAGNLYTVTGMGAEAIATPGTQVAPVGRPQTLF